MLSGTYYSQNYASIIHPTLREEQGALIPDPDTLRLHTWAFLGKNQGSTIRQLGN